MKRKIVLHGPSTLTVSIPSKWARNFNLSKGDELNVEELGDRLIVSLENVKETERKDIRVRNFKRLGKTYLTASYRQGYDEVVINFDGRDYVGTIQGMLSETMGYGIVKQESCSCTIKDLTGHRKNEFDNVLRRIWLMLLDLANESFNLMQRKDVEGMKNISLMDASINRFCNYCLRILTKDSSVPFRKVALYYHLIKSLEELADSYKDLCNFYAEHLDEVNKPFLDLFYEVNQSLVEFYEVFYKYDDSKMEELFRKTKASRIKALHFRKNVAYYLAAISVDIRNLLSVLVEIKL